MLASTTQQILEESKLSSWEKYLLDGAPPTVNYFCFDGGNVTTSSSIINLGFTNKYK